MKELSEFSKDYNEENIEFAESKELEIITNYEDEKIEEANISECFDIIHKIVHEIDDLYVTDCGEYSIYIKYKNGKIESSIGCLCEPVEYNNIYMQYYLKKITCVDDLKCLSLMQY